MKSGGGIYAKGGEFIFFRVCGFRCETHSSGSDLDGVFCNTYANNNKSRNYFILSQISYCSNANYGYPLCIHYGICLSKYLNVSKNNCYQVSAMRIQPSSENLNNISFSSITNNTSSQMAFEFSAKSMVTTNFMYVHYTNILYNMQTSSSFGIICIWMPIKIEKCCIIGNESPSYIFVIASNVKAVLVHCTIASDQLVSSNRMTTDEMTPESSFINAISLLNTGRCYGEIDQIGTFPLNFTKPEEITHKISSPIYRTCQRARKLNNIGTGRGMNLFNIIF